MWIDKQFPSLGSADYEVTSTPDDDYNCIAYAAGDRSNWWSHAGEYHWPNARRSPSIDSLIEVFIGLGFEICDNGEKATGFDKVALYAKDGNWTHVAVQLPGGDWSSKLGPDEDIRHAALQALAGESYGTVHCCMRRPSRTGSGEPTDAGISTDHENRP